MKIFTCVFVPQGDFDQLGEGFNRYGLAGDIARLHAILTMTKVVVRIEDALDYFIAERCEYRDADDDNKEVPRMSWHLDKDHEFGDAYTIYKLITSDAEFEGVMVVREEDVTS